MVGFVVVDSFSFPLSVHCENYVLEMCLSFLIFFFFPQRAQLAGESKYEENWKDLTKMLNNTLGPKKTVEEWKMVKT